MESNFKNTVEALIGGMENFISSKTVVGEPIHIEDTIILPLVDVAFGVGAGVGSADDKKGENPQGAGGGGLGAKITPSAVLVIQNGHTKLVNIKNQDSLTKIIDLVPDIMDRFAARDKKPKMKNEEEAE